MGQGTIGGPPRITRPLDYLLWPFQPVTAPVLHERRGTQPTARPGVKTGFQVRRVLGQPLDVLDVLGPDPDIVLVDERPQHGQFTGQLIQLVILRLRPAGVALQPGQFRRDLGTPGQPPGALAALVLGHEPPEPLTDRVSPTAATRHSAQVAGM